MNQEAKERAEHAAVLRLSKAIAILCDGQPTAVGGVAVLFAAIALRMSDSGQSRNGAIELLRAQLEDMKEEPGAAS